MLGARSDRCAGRRASPRPRRPPSTEAADRPEPPSGRPADGTIGFINGRQYAIALALLDEGEPVVGILGCPNLERGRPAGEPAADWGPGSMFAAVRGAGAFTGDCLPAGGAQRWADVRFPSERIRMRTPRDAPGGGGGAGGASAAAFLRSCKFMESVEAGHSNHALASSIAGALSIGADPVRIDSQAKYGALGRGDGDIYMRFPSRGYREKIWDHAAGYVVITEAGGVVSEGSGGPLDFGLGRFLGTTSGIVAAVPDIHPLLVEAARGAGA